MIDTAERRTLRETVTRFVASGVLPYQEVWEHDGEVPRSLARTLGFTSQEEK